MLAKTEGRRRRGREDEMVGWHHRLNGHGFEHALGDGERQRSLECCSPWGHKESDMNLVQTCHFLQGEEDQLLLPTLQPLYSYRCGKEVIYLIGEFRKNKSGASSLALPTPKTLLSALGCLTAENIFLHCSSRSKSSPLLLRSVCKLA